MLPYVGCYEERYRLTCRIAGSLAFSLASLAAGIFTLCRSQGFVPRVRRSHRPASRSRACQPHDRVPRLMMVRPCPRSARSRTSGWRAWGISFGKPSGNAADHRGAVVPIGRPAGTGLGPATRRVRRCQHRPAGRRTYARRKENHAASPERLPCGHGRALLRFREPQILPRRARGTPFACPGCRCHRQNDLIWARSLPVPPDHMDIQNGGYFATAHDLGGIRSVMQEAA